MKKLIQLIFVLNVLFLASCAATHRYELKAPCDPKQCKNRLNVNTWNNN